LIFNRLEGGTYEQLLVCGDAPAADFRDAKTLAEECPAYSWRLVLSGGLLYLTEVSVPLQCAASQIALIWLAIISERGVVESVRLGTDHNPQLEELMPALNLKKSGLHIRKFENAVLGLIFASNAIQSPHITCAVNLQGCLTDVDLRCLEFSKQRIRQLADAIAVGHTQGFLKAVNCLLVDDKEHFNLQDCVKRSDELTKDERPLSAQLDWVDWRYVMLKVSDFGWKKLDME